MGAKYTNKDIKPDEVLQNNFSFTYDGKRDRLVQEQQLLLQGM